jgi:hypothetical protein
MGINTQWIDVRNFIKPILITEMPQRLGSYFREYFEKQKKNIEHYLGSWVLMKTLGREGSDYTAAILPIA